MAYGGKFIGTIDGKTNCITQTLPVADGVTVAVGDFVYWSSGRITNASVATQRLIGCVQEAGTGNTAGTVKVKVIVDPAARYIVDNDNDSTTFAITHVGTYFDLTGATGLQQVDTSSTSTSGSLYATEYNPQIDPYKSDTSIGVFVIAEHAWRI
jgi:hypothetical protein